MARDLSTYLEHIRVNAESTQRLFRTAYGSFIGIEEFIGSGPDNDEIYDYLQKWINGSKNDPATKRTYFSLIKQYLHYRGVKMHPIDIRQCLNFPAKHEEEMHPLGIDEFRRILEECGHKRGAMYLAQASSGMRIGEITQIRREHLHVTRGSVTAIPSSASLLSHMIVPYTARMCLHRLFPCRWYGHVHLHPSGPNETS